MIYQYNFMVQIDKEYKLVEVRAHSFLGAVRAAMRYGMDMESKQVLVERLEVS